jgi:type IV pilus assembly protein PilM
MAKRNKIGIGLDVGSRSIQLAVLKTCKGGVAVERVATKELTHDAIVEGAVMDSEFVCGKIAELLTEQKLKGKDAAISISGRRVMIKKITTDEMTDDELNATIAYEAKSNLPFDTSEVCLDFARMPQEADTGRMEILLVAAKNENVFDAVETLRWAGGKAVLLEAEPFALQAALAEAGYLDDQSAVAALQVGFQSTDVTMFNRGQFDSNRNLNVGGKSYIEGLIKELGIPFERASNILAKKQHTEEEGEVLLTIARRVSEKIAEQVERSFPENFGTSADNPVTRIVLCGGGAHLPLLESELRQHFGVDVDVANPFRHFEVSSKMDSTLVDTAPDYAAAVGLALRAMGDRHAGFNLLFEKDKPEHKKAQYAGFGTILPIVGFSALLFGVIMIHLAQENKLTALNKRLDGIRKETDLYRDKIGLVEQLTKKRADVAARIDVIAELDRNRFARVKLMQLINNSLPEYTWITDVTEANFARGSGLNISGLTSSNLKVSQFMTNLLESGSVRGVDLAVSEQAEIAGTNVTRFTLQVALPGLGLTLQQPDKPEDKLKTGVQAVREKKAAEAKLKKEASK